MDKTFLHTLIQSKTRMKLLLRFFLNPDSSAYLRGLADEFDESTNSVRLELNRFEKAGFIKAHKDGNKKIYTVNTEYPLFGDIQQIAFKHFGIDQIVEAVVKKLGDIQTVYVTGDLARGLDTQVIDVTLIGDDINRQYLSKLVIKTEKLIGRKLRTLVYSTDDKATIEQPKLLIYGEE